MRHYDITTTLNEGDLTELRGELYVAARWRDSKPCREQCDCARSDGTCNGFCFRWDNAADFVLHRAETPKGDHVVKITPYAFQSAAHVKANREVWR